MAGYITQEDLVDKMPLREIIQACTDTPEDEPPGDPLAVVLTPAQIWDLIQQGVSDEIDGLMAPRYSRPFPDPVHPRLKTAARWFTLETLYTRRGMYGEANPATPKADAERKSLREIGTGKVLLDLLTPLPQAPAGLGAAAATEEMRTKPSGGRLMG